MKLFRCVGRRVAVLLSAGEAGGQALHILKCKEGRVSLFKFKVMSDFFCAACR